MDENQYELAQHCIDSDEFITVKFANRYFLCHQSIVKYSNDAKLNLELSPATIRKILGFNPMAFNEAQMTMHVGPACYDLIIFADKSIVHTHKRTLSNENGNTKSVKKLKILPYYVNEDLELLKNCGMSQEEIDAFIKKLDANDNLNMFNFNEHDRIIEKIIFYTDIPTRLKCRQVSQKWKSIVDNSNSWYFTKLMNFCRCINGALKYFQNIDIRELDLSESTTQQWTLDLQNEYFVYSLRSLSLSTNHPIELFTLLFKAAPFVHHIKLIQNYDSSSTLKTNIELCDFINFILCECQQRLKCLRRLQIQLRSLSDQILLESSCKTPIPVSYEVITC